MENKAYWQKRSERRLLDLLSVINPIIKDLEQYYNEAINDIDKSIKSLYGQFMSENGLDKNKAMALIKGDEYRTWRMSMEDYLKEIKESKDQALVIELNTLAMRSRINRLEALQGEILGHSAMIASKEEKVLQSFLSDAVEESYYKNFYDEYKAKNPEVLKLMNEHRVGISRNQVKKILELPWSGNNYSKNIWENSYFIAKRAEKIVAKNIISGRSIENLSRDLVKAYSQQYLSNIKRLIRTETAYVKGQADVLTYEKLGIEEYELLATLDNRTSSICQGKDGKHYPVDEIKVGINYPPFHPNCRTTTIKYREDYGDRTRIAKDKDGNSVKVPLDMKYEEWKKWIEDPDNKSIEEFMGGKDIKLEILKDSGISEEDYKAYINLIKNSGNKGLIKLYKSYGDELLDVIFGEESYYSPDMNFIEFTLEDNSTLPRFKPLAHEYGHFLDGAYTGECTFKEVGALSKYLPEEINLTTQNFSSSDQFLEAVRKDKKNLHEMGFYVLAGEVGYRDSIFSSVQDASDGMFEGRGYRMHWGHGEEYYDRSYNDYIRKESGLDKKLFSAYKDIGMDVSTKSQLRSQIRDFETASELWANIISAITCKTDELEVISEFLPNSYQEVLKLLKGV